jgi:hypothetical protein
MQQARERPEEEAVEVVRNDEDGTSGEGGSLGAEAASDGSGSGLRKPHGAGDEPALPGR